MCELRGRVNLSLYENYSDPHMNSFPGYISWRGRVGVEPTTSLVLRPANGFADRRELPVPTPPDFNIP